MAFNDPISHAIQTLLWITSDDVTDCDDAELSPELEALLRAEWATFEERATELGFDPIEHRASVFDPSQGDERAYMAHDWILTRNRCGAGFWDGGWDKEFGQKLTDLRHQQGEIELYLGDDQLIYAL